MNASSTARRAALPARFGPCSPSPVHSSLRSGGLEATIDLSGRAAVRADVQPLRARGASATSATPALAHRRAGEHDLPDLRRGPLRPLPLQRERQLQHPAPACAAPRPEAGERAPRTRHGGTRGPTHPASPRATRTSRPSGPTCSRSASARTSRPRSAFDRRRVGRVADQRVAEQADLPATLLLHLGCPPGARATSERGTFSAHHAPVARVSCCAQQPARRARDDDPPRIARPEPQHPRPSRDRDRLQRIRDAAPRRHDRPELRIQRDRASREMRPDQLCPLSEPAQPATNRVRVHPEPRAIRRYPSPATFASIAAPITADLVLAPQQTRSGSSTCVPAQPRHRARRGRNNRSPDQQRSTRSRACPHGPNTP